MLSLLRFQRHINAHSKLNQSLLSLENAIDTKFLCHFLYQIPNSVFIHALHIIYLGADLQSCTHFCCFRTLLAVLYQLQSCFPLLETNIRSDNSAKLLSENKEPDSRVGCSLPVARGFLRQEVETLHMHCAKQYFPPADIGALRYHSTKTLLSRLT
jgi:hypothetical protein